MTADLVSRAPLVPVLVLNLGGSRARQQRGVELVLADRRTGLAILRDTLDTNRWVFELETKDREDFTITDRAWTGPLLALEPMLNKLPVS